MKSLRERLLGAGFTLVTALVPVAAQSDDAPDAGAAETSRPIESTHTRNDADDATRGVIEPRVSSEALAAAAARGEKGGRVMDRMALERTEITGNQELPKVLYIVPWRKADPSDLMGRPVNTLLDEVLAPIDREEFVRAVGYYEDLYGDDDE